MTYKYAVIWFNLARSWISGKYWHKGKYRKFKRPIEVNCKMFHSLKNADKWRKKIWSKPYPHIYELKGGR